METLVAIVVLVLLLLPLGIAISRATELFVLRVDRGQVHLVRGRMPPSLLGDVRDVFERSHETGRVYAISVRGLAEIQVQGEISATTLQQLRNVIGNVPVQRIRTGKLKQ